MSGIQRRLLITLCWLSEDRCRKIFQTTYAFSYYAFSSCLCSGWPSAKQRVPLRRHFL